MNLVEHRATGQDAHLRPAAAPGKQVEVQGAIVVAEERRLAPVVSLRDMMRQAGNEEAGDAGHEAKVRRREANFRRAWELGAVSP